VGTVSSINAPKPRAQSVAIRPSDNVQVLLCLITHRFRPNRLRSMHLRWAHYQEYSVLPRGHHHKALLARLTEQAIKA
jgi:hypothetical protein